MLSFCELLSNVTCMFCLFRSESFKKEKPQKRTLSLKTRKHTHSFKDKYRLPTELPPSEMEGMLDRKQELQSGGKKATIRSWKSFYTVLCGQLLCFFKDRQGNLCKYGWNILRNFIKKFANVYKSFNENLVFSNSFLYFKETWFSKLKLIYIFDRMVISSQNCRSVRKQCCCTPSCFT